MEGTPGPHLILINQKEDEMKLLKKLVALTTGVGLGPPLDGSDAYRELYPPNDNRVFAYVRQRGTTMPVIPAVLFDVRLGPNWEFVGEPQAMRPQHYHLNNRELSKIYPKQQE